MGPFEMRESDFLYVSDKKETKLNTMETDFTFKMMKTGTTFVVDFFPQVMVGFDGNSVQMIAGPQIRGTNCGMCGDYNRNKFYELKDPLVG